MTTTSEKRRGRDSVSRTAGHATTRTESSNASRSGAPPSSCGNTHREGLNGDAGGTAISCCVQDELLRYFDMLDGEKPSGLYRMVIRQAEHALLHTVMRECGGNQSRAAEWLGISRGNLRNKLADMD